MYTPAPVIGNTLEELRNFIDAELRVIAENFAGVSEVQLTVQNVEPTKPRDGLIALADGTNWNPGSGAGFYGYRGGSWVLLG